MTKYEGKGTRISILKLFNELGKIWKCNLGFSKIPIFHLFYELGKTLAYTQPQNSISKCKLLNLWMSWENSCPNLSFTVKNKMENSHKRGWTHFKLKINDWDIPFPKSLRVYQWIGKKKIFIGENGMNPFSWWGTVLDWRLK